MGAYLNPIDIIREAGEQARKDENEFFKDNEFFNLKTSFLNLLTLMLDKKLITAEEIEHKVFEGK
jgi:hypothetical protein